MNKIVLLILIIGFSYSCKESSNRKENNIEIENKLISKSLTVNFSFKTNKSDVFRIILNNIEVDDLQKKNINIFERVNPSNEFDRIIAKFDSDNLSNNLVINLGNKEQKEIKINTIEFAYDKNAIVITKSNFDKFLRVNQFIDYNKENFSIKTKRVNEKHSPSIIARKTLIDFLTKEGSKQ